MEWDNNHKNKGGVALRIMKENVEHLLQEHSQHGQPHHRRTKKDGMTTTDINRYSVHPFRGLLAKER
jgi:hypothetical protein